MVKKVGERAQRKDKKKQIRPWLPGTHSAEIRSLTKFLGASSRASVMEHILVTCVKERRFIDYVKPYMMRTIRLPVSHDASYFFTLIGNSHLDRPAEGLYSEIKVGVTYRGSFYVTKEIVELYLHPLTSGLDISYDGLATITMDYALRELMDRIAPSYKHRYILKQHKRSNQLTS